MLYATFPPFGTTGLSELLSAADSLSVRLSDIAFGAEVGSGTTSVDDILATRCPAKAWKTLAKHQHRLFKQHAKCAKKALKGRSAAGPISNPVQLRDSCPIASETARIEAVLAKHCSSLPLEDVFPACGDPGNTQTTSACLATKTTCAVCETIAEVEQLAYDCDLVDNAVDDGSCREQYPMADKAYELVHTAVFPLTVWLSYEFTNAEFLCLEAPEGYFKNQVREGTPDEAEFFSSPGRPTGEFTDEELVGKDFFHAVNIVQLPQTIGEGVVLNDIVVHKNVRLRYNSGRTLHLLTSPEGEEYFRISRDFNRETETAEFPAGWSTHTIELTEDLDLYLLDDHHVLRDSIEDGWQGPVTDQLPD